MAEGVVVVVLGCDVIYEVVWCVGDVIGLDLCDVDVCCWDEDGSFGDAVVDCECVYWAGVVCYEFVILAVEVA